MSRALVLNATFEPLGAVASRRALLLVLERKAELLEATGRRFHAMAVSYPEPSVVRLSRYVHVPYQARIALNRRSIFARDGYKCQYCGAAAENIDHVVPRSRGGEHVWENVVAACKRCNSRKEDHLPHEVGLRLAKMPTRPMGRAWILLAEAGVRSEWLPYLGQPITEQLAITMSTTADFDSLAG
jgi:5-methylcytosine-specific restriction endonuclease McrA